MKTRRFNPTLMTYSLLICGVLLVEVACNTKDLSVLASSNPNLQHERQKQHGFEIYIFDVENLSEALSPEIVEALSENNLSTLSSNNLIRADMVITEGDIITYDWGSQKIVLRDAFRQRYISRELLWSPFSVFIVLFERKPLFSGKLLWTFSASGSRAPVLYVPSSVMAASGDELTIYVRPHSVIYLEEDMNVVFPIEDAKLVEQIRAHLEENGK